MTPPSRLSEIEAELGSWVNGTGHNETHPVVRLFALARGLEQRAERAEANLDRIEKERNFAQMVADRRLEERDAARADAEMWHRTRDDWYAWAKLRNREGDEARAEANALRAAIRKRRACRGNDPYPLIYCQTHGRAVKFCNEEIDALAGDGKGDGGVPVPEPGCNDAAAPAKPAEGATCPHGFRRRGRADHFAPMLGWVECEYLCDHGDKPAPPPPEACPGCVDRALIRKGYAFGVRDHRPACPTRKEARPE